MTTDQTADRNHPSFSSAFFNALLAAMTQASGSPWLLDSAADSGSTPEESEPVRINLRFDGSLHGDLLLEFHRAEAAVLASQVLRQPADEFGEEHADALLKLIATAGNEFCSAGDQRYGTFTIKASSASQPPVGRTNVVQMAASNDAGARVEVSMCIDPALTEALLLHSETASTAAGVGSSENAAENKAVPEPVNLDLVMNVELNVTLRFGQRQLTLREVLELTSGSVVELDRQVEEPVELLLNGMVIARGEAVVIDGNYGLRVTEVTQPVSSLDLR
jgi:flagellar motor switch protein FliN/FliY